MQLDPIKPTLKAPGSERLKLKCDHLVSKFAFTFYLRRYTKATYDALATSLCKVGRCRLIL